jgi:hypothetical protein
MNDAEHIRSATSERPCCVIRWDAPDLGAEVVLGETGVKAVIESSSVSRQVSNFSAFRWHQFEAC